MLQRISRIAVNKMDKAISIERLSKATIVKRFDCGDIRLNGIIRKASKPKMLKDISQLMYVLQIFSRGYWFFLYIISSSIIFPLYK